VKSWIEACAMLTPPISVRMRENASAHEAGSEWKTSYVVNSMIFVEIIVYQHRLLKTFHILRRFKKIKFLHKTNLDSLWATHVHHCQVDELNTKDLAEFLRPDLIFDSIEF
jgi:hypothetical protein